jgi:hypothetical protein
MQNEEFVICYCYAKTQWYTPTRFGYFIENKFILIRKLANTIALEFIIDKFFSNFREFK